MVLIAAVYCVLGTNNVPINVPQCNSDRFPLAHGSPKKIFFILELLGSPAPILKLTFNGGAGGDLK